MCTQKNSPQPRERTDTCNLQAWTYQELGKVCDEGANVVAFVEAVERRNVWVRFQELFRVTALEIVETLAGEIRFGHCGHCGETRAKPE